MNEEAISYIMLKMSNCLDNSQMIRLEKTLEEALRGEETEAFRSWTSWVWMPLKSVEKSYHFLANTQGNILLTISVVSSAGVW